MENKQKNEVEKLMTLEDFLKQNEKLITTFGVFIALTMFAMSLPIKIIGAGLSFLFLTLSILIWIELWRKFPSKEGSLSLNIFENMLALITLVIIANWLLDYRRIWHEILFLPIFGILATAISYIIKKFNIFNQLFHTKKDEKRSWRYFLGNIIIGTILFFSFIIAKVSSPPINKFLDELSNFLKQKNL
jgi:hypothetical protein